MPKIFGERAVLPTNLLWTMIIVGYLAVHTVLFTHVNDRLNKALRRMDKLELLLANRIDTEDLRLKEMGLSWSRNLKTRLTVERDKMKGKEFLRTRREVQTSDRVARLLRKIKRLEQRVKELVRQKRNMKRMHDATRIAPIGEVKKGKSTLTSKIVKKTRSARSAHRNSNSKIPAAVYTYWGSSICPRRSRIIHKGQTVTADGSNFLCLPDNGSHEPIKPKRSRNVGSIVDIRGVVYGDIEDVMIANQRFPTRNNKTVPCAVCSRKGRTSSVMLLSFSKDSLYPKYAIQAEYEGVLMSTKESKKFICVSIGAQSYPSNSSVKNRQLSDTVQLHPGELKCNSLYCDSSKSYLNGYRVSCVVGTI